MSSENRKEVAMTPVELAELCYAQGLLISRRYREGVVVLATGRQPDFSHWVQLSITQNARVSLLVPFPRSAARIWNAEEACQRLSEHFYSGAGLFYDEKEGRFYLHHVADRELLGSNLAIVAHDCDLAKPVCARVAILGRWEPQLLLHLRPVIGERTLN